MENPPGSYTFKTHRSAYCERNNIGKKLLIHIIENSEKWIKRRIEEIKNETLDGTWIIGDMACFALCDLYRRIKGDRTCNNSCPLRLVESYEHDREIWSSCHERNLIKGVAEDYEKYKKIPRDCTGEQGYDVKKKILMGGMMAKLFEFSYELEHIKNTI